MRSPLAIVVLPLCVLMMSPAAAGDMSGFLRGLAAPRKAAQRTPPPIVRGDAVEHLADGLDWLRHELDEHGSIVAKEPDVWGQSRLLRHRVEYEDQLHRQLGLFTERSSAAIRRSDQSFLGMALAVQAALPQLGERPDSTTTVRSAPFMPLHDAAALGFDDAPLAVEPVIHVDQLSRYVRHIQALRRINEGDDTADSPGYALTLVRIPVSIVPGRLTRKGHGAEITLIAEPCLDDSLLPQTFRSLVINDLIDVITPALTWCVNDPTCVAWAESIAAEAGAGEDATRRAATLRALAARLPAAAPASPPGLKTRRSRLPIPFSQLAEVSGPGLMAILIRDTRRSLAAHPASRPCLEYVDVRGHLAEELEAAYDFLARERFQATWVELAGWQLPELVRGRRGAELAELRCRFLASLADDLVLPPAAAAPLPPGDACCSPTRTAAPICRTTTAALAWGILVESSLLDERLAADMIAAGGDWPGPCYGPEPSAAAREGFNAHVRRRWPIRVFALDPVTDEQNVEDAFARRRETQIALAVAAAGGRAATQAAVRASRRLETDIATVALNRTAVGFSHGSDTFGWRFYPRVQTPPTRGGLAAVAESVCGGPTSDADLMQRQLEPGQRECTALVVMPAFVPAVQFDVRSCWFSLVHPQATDQSLRRSTRLARAVESLRQEQAASLPACPPGTAAALHGLSRELERLARRLPLQSLAARIPYENTAGGFELFTAGITDLAPELLGWYGAPGIDPAGTTTLFLVGKGFSVHDTLVIAGGRPVPCRLMSRELLRAEIPPGTATLLPGPAARCRAEPPAQPLAARPELLPAPAVIPTPAPEQPSIVGADCGGRECVDIHLATPYGVSGHLLVPVHRRGDVGSQPTVDAATIRLSFTVARSAAAGGPVARVDEFFAATSESVSIRMPAAFVPPAKATLQFTVRDAIRPVAGFSCDTPPYDARGSRYLLAGGDLRNLIGDTSRPASDKTLRGGVKPYLDHLLGSGQLDADGDAVTLTVTAVLVAGQQEIPLAGDLTVIATRRGRAADIPDAEAAETR